MADRWLTAYDTRQLVADRRRDEGQPDLKSIGYAIIDYARTVLPARCQYMWEINLDDDGPGRKKDACDVAVPPSVWDLVEDLKMDWNTGIFHLAGDQDGHTKYVKLVGLEFNAAAVDRIWPDKTASLAHEALAGRSEPSIPNNAGRPRSERWDNWIAYLVVASNDIVREEGTDALINKVADLMAEDGLEPMSRSTVQSAARAVIELMKRKRL